MTQVHQSSRCRQWLGYRLPVLTNVLVILILGGGQLSSTHGVATKHDDLGIWRTPSNDGVTCLYLQLRILGYTPDYHLLDESLGSTPASLQDLALSAQRCGASLLPAQLTFQDLSSLSTPRTVLLEPDGIGSGTFALFVANARGRVDYIDGSSARWRQVSIENFRRIWTGYALAEPQSLSFVSWLVRWCLVPLTAYLLTCVGFFMVRRFRQNRASGLSANCVSFATLVLLVCGAIGDNALAQRAMSGVALEPEIASALERAATELTPLTVKWTQQFNSISADAYAQLKIDGPDRELFFARSIHQFTVQGALFYSRVEQTPRGGPTRVAEHSFDGRVLYLGTPPSGQAADETFNASLSKYSVGRLSQNRPDDIWFTADYLEAAGFSVATTAKELKAGKVPRSRVLSLIDDGTLISSEKSDVDGRACIRIEIEAPNWVAQQALRIAPEAAESEWRLINLDENRIKALRSALEEKRRLPPVQRYVFYLDPTRAYAAIRYELRRPDGILTVAGTNEALRQIADRSIYLPHRCRAAYYSWPTAGKVFDQPVLSSTIDVTSLETELNPPETFVLNYTEPGTSILDSTSAEGETQYQIPASPADLENAIRRSHASGLIGSTTSRWLYWMILAIGCCLIVAALAIWKRAALRKP